MKARQLHSWNVSPAEAVAIQRRLAADVRVADGPGEVRLVAGVDVSVGDRAHHTRTGKAAVVVLQWPGLAPVEQSVVEADVSFPYVPGLLSFREIPVLLPAFERLQHTPDLLIVDGQGIAHPRRLGLASHLGLVFDVPSIGCAKSRLVGDSPAPLPAERGAIEPIIDRGRQVGTLVRTRTGVKPLWVSPGHRVGLDFAAGWVLATGAGYRLPEPTRLAHLAAAGARVAPEFNG